jgi:hypothetical protein
MMQLTVDDQEIVLVGEIAHMISLAAREPAMAA